jgi:hypothetical protein
MWEQISPVLMSTLTTIIIAAIGLLGAYALSLIKQATEKIKAETNKINDETQRKLVQDALDRVSNLAQKTVQKIEQTSAAAVREAVKDGKVNREEFNKYIEVKLEEYKDDKMFVHRTIQSLKM